MVKFISAFLLLLSAVFASSEAAAQKLLNGEKAPEMKYGEWIISLPSGSTAASYIEFIHPASPATAKRIPQLESMALKYAGRISIILIARDEPDKTRALFSGKTYHFSVAMDDKGKSFDSYGVRYVPFGVLINGKGKVVWFGNPASLTETEISKAL